MVGVKGVVGEVEGVVIVVVGVVLRTENLTRKGMFLLIVFLVAVFCLFKFIFSFFSF